jgi:hypothetical protein
MAFERFIPARTTSVRPRVAIRPTGLISFDATAVESFGLESATAALLYFDRARKMIGIQVAKSADEEGAYRLSRRRGSVSLKAPEFFERFGLAFAQTQQFDVGHDKAKGMLTISVKGVQRRRGRPRQS